MAHFHMTHFLEQYGARYAGVIRLFFLNWAPIFDWCAVR